MGLGAVSSVRIKLGKVRLPDVEFKEAWKEDTPVPICSEACPLAGTLECRPAVTSTLPVFEVNIEDENRSEGRPTGGVIVPSRTEADCEGSVNLWLDRTKGGRSELMFLLAFAGCASILPA